MEAQVARSPEAVALVDGERYLTYAELDTRANRLAHHLRELGVDVEVPVGISVGRSADMAVGLLAILKAGGACLPLDPAYPAKRLAFMLDDAAAPVLLTQSDRSPGNQHRSAMSTPRRSGCRRVDLDADAQAIATRPPHPPDRHLHEGHLAYLLYTSGSTGVPKGVMLEHKALVAHHRSAIGLYRLAPGDRVLQFCSMSFDVSVEELFPTWAAGATVVLRPDDVPILGRPWTDWIKGAGISVLNLPTAYWHEWVADLRSRGQRLPPALRLVVVGGDKALGALYQDWREVGGDGVRWINAYGPTEATIMSTTYEPAADREDLDRRDPPIGRPLPHATVHLLDGRGQPVAPGSAGEVYIGGPALARGYLNRPELTAERFVADPYSERPGDRLYRTGDLARAGADGELEFVGRLDEQVKVRGFRIEVGEVETALASHPGVAGVAVAAREDRPGNKRLVAYTMPAGDGVPAPGELRRFLAERLPGYMVPTAYLSLDALPLTPNGKLDRAALPAPNANADRRPGVDVSPRTPAEKALVVIWSEVLGVEDPGLEDDFFDLGGHSLLAAQAVARVREVLGVELPLAAIFEAPTVAGLAAVLDALGPSRGADAPSAGGDLPLVARPRVPGQRIPLSLPQEQMWRLEAQASPRGLYNITAEHRFAGTADQEALRRALAHLVERHEVLRTSFPSEAGRPWQAISPSVPIDLDISDLSATPASERGGELDRQVGLEDARPFDLDVAPLVRAQLFLMGDAGDVVALTFDHLVCDGTSAYVFLSELAAAYQAFVDDRAPVLRPLPIQYADYALWQRQWLTDDRLDAQLTYWKDTLAGMPLGPAIPFDRVPDTPSRRIATRTLALDAPAYRRLQGLVRQSRATVFVACVAALQAVSARLGGMTDVVLSTTTSGRNRPELEGAIGFFAGVGRIRTDLAGDPSFAEVMARARERVLGLFDHQDIPFMRVRDALLPDFPTHMGAVELMSVLPTEIQYFHVAHDEWAPGIAVIERPGPDAGSNWLYFRGQLPPLSVTFLDDGSQLWAECNYKVDFYEDATVEALARSIENVLVAASAGPSLRLSQVPVTAVDT